MNSQDRLVYVEQVKSIYKQTSTVVVGGVVVGIIFVSIFWRVADHASLLTWLVCLMLLSFARVPPTLGFLRRNDDDNIRFWGDLYVLLTFLHGLLWGAAFIIFNPVDHPIYNVVVAMWIVGMSAASVSAYTAHLKSLLMFFVPAVIPGTIYLMIIGGPLNTALSIAICVYVVAVLRSVLPVNQAMVESIRLNFKLEKEIEERINIEEKLREISLKDSLTGLSNRRHFDEVLANELQRAQRNTQPLSLILIDIDYFKDFNDTYGHVAGDVCLQRLSQLIEETTKRTGDLAARYGGEELVLILPNTDTINAGRIAEAIRKNVHDLNLPHDSSRVEGCKFVTVSAGVVTKIPGRETTASEIIQVADDALYKAKANGRNRVE